MTNFTLLPSLPATRSIREVWYPRSQKIYHELENTIIHQMTEVRKKLSVIEVPYFETFGEYFMTSHKVKKGTGQEIIARGIETFSYYSLTGLLEEARVTSISLSEYSDAYPFDVIDLVVELTPEQILRLSPPVLDSDEDDQ